MDKQTLKNLEYLCKKVVDTKTNLKRHGLTSHATDEGIKYYYIGYIDFINFSVMITIDLEDLLNNLVTIDYAVKYINNQIAVQLNKYFFSKYNQEDNIDYSLDY